MPVLVGQERLDQGGGFRWPRHHEQVPVIDHAELGVRDQARQENTIDWRDQWIVAAHQDERLLRQRPQPWQAGPTGHGKELVQVAQVAGAMHRGRMPVDQ